MLSALAFASKASWGYDRGFMQRVKDALQVGPQYIEEHPVYVLLRGGEVAGFFGFISSAEETLLNDFWIEPRFIGTGMGRIMWKHAVATARNFGCTSFVIQSDPNAQGFYVRMGAERIGSRRAPESGRELPLLQFIVPEPVILQPYDPEWPNRFEREAAQIRALLMPFGLVGLEHVGSTAIPGMPAKPIVDIVAGMDDLRRVPDAESPCWANAGYEYGHGPDRPDDWRYFIKRDDSRRRLVHLHIVPFRGTFWTRIIAFRDALRENAVLTAQYVALKRALAEKHTYDRFSYVEGKAAFVESVVERSP